MAIQAGIKLFELILINIVLWVKLIKKHCTVNIDLSKNVQQSCYVTCFSTKSIQHLIVPGSTQVPPGLHKL